MSSSLRAYMQEVSRHRLLSREDEVRLAKRVEAGAAAKQQLADSTATRTPAERSKLTQQVKAGKKARDRFVTANLRLVIHYAKRMPRTMPLEDMIQEGNIGLIRAVEKFDWRKGFKFSTYASYWIWQAIQRHTSSNSSVIRIPPSAHDQIVAYRKTINKLTSQLTRDPTLDEIAAEMAVPIDEAMKLRVWDQRMRVVSLSSPLAGSDRQDRQLVDTIPDLESTPPDEKAVFNSTVQELRQAMKVLPKPERQLIEHLYPLDGQNTLTGKATLADVCNKWNINRSKGRAMRARAMSQMLHPSAPVNQGR